MSLYDRKVISLWVISLLYLLLMLIVHAQIKIDPSIKDHWERQLCPFSVKKSSVELQKYNLLCFTILYLKDSTNVINSLKKLNIAAGQCAPLKPVNVSLCNYR